MRSLNRGILPAGFYALEEQVAGGLGPDVLTLRGLTDAETSHGSTNAHRQSEHGGHLGRCEFDVEIGCLK